MLWWVKITKQLDSSRKGLSLNTLPFKLLSLCLSFMISLNLLLSILSPFPLSLLIVSCSELCMLLRSEGLASHWQLGAAVAAGGVENVPSWKGRWGGHRND